MTSHLLTLRTLPRVDNVYFGARVLLDDLVERFELGRVDVNARLVVRDIILVYDLPVSVRLQ